MTVRQTGSSPEAGLPALLWKGAHASNSLRVLRGEVGVAYYGGESATVPVLDVGGEGRVVTGAGVVLTTVRLTGGAALETRSGATTITLDGGRLVVLAGNVTTLTVDSGEVAYKGTGVIGTLNAGNEAVIDFSQDTRPRTVTTTNVYAGAALNDPLATVTWTNPILLVRTNLSRVRLDLGENKSYAIA